ncbi:sensor histidine kinase [Enterococcus faecium]|uniref:sensor histidine kinase n=1 Tax=Enterococcus faecium TaxID=1352 RepID=UPI0024144DE8|nr:HAMP domain-containing sensor histidine kinase [Enterococcus faecium]MDG4589188.1 HAMP domain-containing sensor histidine kinase [Enterococcus faecium]
MPRLNYKINIVILLYSLIITFVFTCCVKYFQTSTLSFILDMERQIEYVVGSESLYNQYEVDQLYQEESQINKNHTQAIAKELTLFSFLFCLFFIGSSFLLWFILNIIQKKNNSRIALQFKNVNAGTEFFFTDPQLDAAYQHLSEYFKNHLENYKRLHSYLSHEQKNMIAILRASMEMNKHDKYLEGLNYLSQNIDDILVLIEQENEDGITTVDVSLCCATLCDMYRNGYPNLYFDFDDESQNTILAKERWIYRAVSNLIDNAIKYGGNNIIHVHVEAKRNTVIIKVQDFGIGISEKQMEYIFNYQYRVSKSQKNGYGIGLNLVAHVCDLCDGYAYVESTLHKGTTFYLSFPQYTECY